jgi:hypothetical protein
VTPLTHAHPPLTWPSPSTLTKSHPSSLSSPGSSNLLRLLLPLPSSVSVSTAPWTFFWLPSVIHSQQQPKLGLSARATCSLDSALREGTEAYCSRHLPNRLFSRVPHTDITICPFMASAIAKEIMESERAKESTQSNMFPNRRHFGPGFFVQLSNPEALHNFMIPLYHQDVDESTTGPLVRIHSLIKILDGSFDTIGPSPSPQRFVVSWNQNEFHSIWVQPLNLLLYHFCRLV